MNEFIWLVSGFVLGTFFGELGKDLYRAIPKYWKQMRSPYREIRHPIKGYYFNQAKPRRIWHRGYFKKR